MPKMIWILCQKPGYMVHSFGYGGPGHEPGVGPQLGSEGWDAEVSSSLVHVESLDAHGTNSLLGTMEPKSWASGKSGLAV